MVRDSQGVVMQMCVVDRDGVVVGSMTIYICHNRTSLFRHRLTCWLVMKRFEDVIDTVLASSSNYLPASYRYTCPCIMSDKKMCKIT